MSVFETFIRVVGGFWLADAVGTASVSLNCVTAAAKVADSLDVAFIDGPVPYPRVDLGTGRGAGMPWFPAGCTSVADAGTIFFELEWLAARTGNQHYQLRANGLLDALGAYTWVRIGSGAPCSAEQFTGRRRQQLVRDAAQDGQAAAAHPAVLGAPRLGSMRATGTGGTCCASGPSTWPKRIVAARLRAAGHGQGMPHRARGRRDALGAQRHGGHARWPEPTLPSTAASRTATAAPRRHHDPLQHSWVVAETPELPLRTAPCGTVGAAGTLSTEATAAGLFNCKILQLSTQIFDRFVCGINGADLLPPQAACQCTPPARP